MLVVILLFVGNMVLPWIPVRAVPRGVLEPSSCSGVGPGARACCNVYFRDVQHFVDIAMQALFYSAPIVYPISARARSTRRSSASTSRCATIYELNPLVRFVEALPRRALRPALPESRARSLYLVAWAVGAAASSACGCSRKLEPRLAEEV